MRMQSQWLGKCFGCLTGLILTQHPAGILIGLFLGHAYDLYRTQTKILDDAFRFKQGWGNGKMSGEGIQRGFMQTLFFLLGKLAKCDGRVCEKEIQWVEQLMRRLYLSHDQRAEAIEWFNQGKAPGVDFEPLLSDFARFAIPFGLNALFMELMVECALADGQMSSEERDLLLHCAKRLKLPQWRLEEFIKRFSGGQQSFGGGTSSGQSDGSKGPAWAGMWGEHSTFESSNSYSSHNASNHRANHEDELTVASRRLGVSTTASRAEVKKAYRRLMNQHHPDKLMSRGVPEAMLNLAKEKTQQIQKDYEIVCKIRGFR